MIKDIKKWGINIMGSLLIAVIYLAFVSLGLPDSLLGSGWPVMQKDFGVAEQGDEMIFLCHFF